MDPIARAAFSSWGWRPEVVIVLWVPGVLFLLGWRKLRRISGSARGARSLGAAWRPVAYISGLLVIGLALMSPIDVLGQQLFFMHMIQHLLLIMVAPVLLLLPNPMPFLLWGLPARARLAAGSALNLVLHKQSTIGRLLRRATSPAIVWFSMIVFIIGWHDPNTYDAALQNELVHDLEHVTMFVAGMLFWWTVIGAGPRLNKNMSLPAKIAFVIAAVPPNMALGAALAFSQEPIYSFYVDMPRLWGMSVLDDQRLSGIIMWIPGSMMYLIAALVLLFRLLSGEGTKTPRNDEPHPSDEALAASGVVVGGASGGQGV
ncbi:MAG: cytochrome c oxidase assembly protein [Anaerolineales bacterium]|uniref:cytochrome c oxidase assembly protein n=1 Tax=Promineifilum sp. TaxID=2664178 RepID=UPI001DDE6896|nr:cytochrome c oxidase assembly protein [Anaerolineales bacterium]MCB8936234.1 cytochrome c oxidase assembly protein [Promineifilum sp.]MCO5181828.1 cytochrome c oxidase assembly protein [Promineifilum sp.]